MFAEVFVARSSALVGSPAQVLDKVYRQHEAFGNEVTYVQQEAEGLSDAERARSVELFATDVAPTLQTQLPARPFVWKGCW
ncbi:hypothetical protein GCM10009609_48090 [Pseudonocardia aurantiaca]|uniref:Uncharacterized protein n=1 Tax=Pseudonocardia aurantiaca TaxID=75290 RepID=A0ABW4FW92_9PSEU